MADQGQTKKKAFLLQDNEFDMLNQSKLYVKVQRLWVCVGCWLAVSEPVKLWYVYQQVIALYIDLQCPFAVPVLNSSFKQHASVTVKSIQVTNPSSSLLDKLAMWLSDANNCYI
ncbi:hypothetical protein ATANTOWER_026425 [Ataeniobius toweri]|uniref:Uncharacterized protein n=1 Tax=Ataeniobius toweri TaxID=208326 RepID=A0ABU7BCG2_9TELE|nr:hypothetical protein [Ataeniobius toweri]